jgi:hypothetical protein
LTSRYVFHLISWPIEWFCQNKKDIYLSTTKDEYKGIINARTKAVWTCNIGEIEFPFGKLTEVCFDNQREIKETSITLLHRVKWSMWSFMYIIWESWYIRKLCLLFIIEQMIELMKYLQSHWWNLSMWNFELFLGFKKIQWQGGVCRDN